MVPYSPADLNRERRVFPLRKSVSKRVPTATLLRKRELLFWRSGSSQEEERGGLISGATGVVEDNGAPSDAIIHWCGPSVPGNQLGAVLPSRGGSGFGGSTAAIRKLGRVSHTGPSAWDYSNLNLHGGVPRSAGEHLVRGRGCLQSVCTGAPVGTGSGSRGGIIDTMYKELVPGSSPLPEALARRRSPGVEGVRREMCPGRSLLFLETATASPATWRGGSRCSSQPKALVGPVAQLPSQDADQTQKRRASSG